MNTDHLRDAPPKNPTNPEKPSTTSNGLSITMTPATTTDTRKPVTVKTLRDPTTCTSPTAACRPSSTSWTATPATWLRSTTMAKLDSPTPTSLLPSSPVNTGRDTSMTPMSPSND
ncbi:integumentary mucin C.1-like [Penaeus chinensis]|uniref:integumentary mucin C.1-like n=1 Tax=Penaeus chinensis TaxID=139456 RepID=UPI001FB6A3FB|nr:integumentary mucin C.1-like [Penaeus chinensis]